ncbi:MAG: glycerol-3-phosphate dehydrogenase [Gemmatimonadota bacterium]|nr:MAG: glycerol-3-phosphate dehydrogenase [Gemmatimonadota bacterium]
MIAAPEAHPFSPAGRVRALERLGTETFDLLVIGGGITGAGVARSAALRGWSVALVEKSDFASGTSSRSSKIVHGGLRYLEYGHFLLVREAARERAVLKRIAPHLVHPLPFLYPVFDGESLIKVRAGLRVFDFLADVDDDEEHKNLKPDEVRARLPGLRDPLKGGVGYLEYITDDARLTMENALSAALHGAAVANWTRLVELGLEDGGVRGAMVEDCLTGTRVDIDARMVVNATGSWAGSVLESSGLPVRHPLIPSKGIHILLSAERLPIRGATFLRATNGKRGLAMRRGDFVYVGTTDDEYSGSLDTPRATRSDVGEVLGMVQDCFPTHGLDYEDVLATWAGIRPLVEEQGKTTRDTSREDEAWEEPDGLITVVGGKLTTYRRMAIRVLEIAQKSLGPPPLDVGGLDATVPLPGWTRGADDPDRVENETATAFRARGVDDSTATRVAWLYGSQADMLLEFGDEDPDWLTPLGPGVPALRGEVRLAVDREMAMTLSDFMDRRAALLLFSEDHGLAGAESAADIMAQRLDWSPDRRNEELDRYRVLAREHGVPES